MSKPKGVSVEMATASAQLQSARIKSSQDGLWRIILTPNDPFGRMLRETLEAVGGCGRTETFPNGGKVSVTSSSEPFGNSDAILIVMGKWQNGIDVETLMAWKAHCSGVPNG